MGSACGTHPSPKHQRQCHEVFSVMYGDINDVRGLLTRADELHDHFPPDDIRCERSGAIPAINCVRKALDVSMTGCARCCNLARRHPVLRRRVEDRPELRS